MDLQSLMQSGLVVGYRANTKATAKQQHGTCLGLASVCVFGGVKGRRCVPRTRSTTGNSFGCETRVQEEQQHHMYTDVYVGSNPSSDG